MRTKLYFVITLLAFFALAALPNGFAQGTLAQPSVRLVYFLPKDRPARPDRIEALRQLIVDVQQFYAEQMEYHGYDGKTFAVETDKNAGPLVHHIDGKFAEEYYYKEGTGYKVWEEILEHFDNFQHIYFTVIDLSSEILHGGKTCGEASLYFSPMGEERILWKIRNTTREEEVLGGFVIIPASGVCFEENREYRHRLGTPIHELGHAFGLDHDFREGSNSDYVMAYGHQSRLSKCAAEWLSVSRFFNSRQILRNDPAKIQLLSSQTHAQDTISLRFEVTDPDGLHQAQLLVADFFEGDGWGAHRLFDCKRLKGETSVVESDIRIEELVNSVTLQITDVSGHITWATFPIDASSLLPPPKVVSLPDPNLERAIRAELGLAPLDAITDRAMRKLKSLNVDERGITNIAGLEYATQLEMLSIGKNQIDNYDRLSQLPKLTKLYLWNNNIKNLDVLPPLLQLELLDINWNQISDVSPLAEFTSLKELWLQGNKLANTSTLFQLHNGTFPPDEEVEVVKERDRSNRAYTLLMFRSLDLKVCINPDVVVFRSVNSFQEAQQPSTPINVLVESSVHPLMYWISTETGTLHHLVGTEVENLMPNVQGVTSLTVDVVGGKLYWTERTSDRTGKIRRVNLDGTNVQLIKDLTSVPHGIALDTANRKIYLTNSWGKVQRLNLDGSNFQPNLITGLDIPKNLALDISEGKIYWTEASGRIRRANLDGSDVENVATGLGTPMDLAVFDGTVYWTEMTGENQGEIQRVNLDGTNTEMLLTLTSIPRGIALDPMENKLYWTNSRGKIQRANLDGSNIENLITGLVSPGDFILQISPPLPPTVPVNGIVSTDVNGDGVVNIQDLVLVASGFGQTGQNAADVNGDGIVNIQDLVLVAGAFGSGAAAAPTSHLQVLEGFTALDVQYLLTQTREMSHTDPAYLRGIAVLEQLLALLVPKETALLSNYPNPFNPETWIPYQLAKPADVTLRIYAASGVLVRTLTLGHQPAGIYQNRSRAAYWDGRNELGEKVASGIYFYTLSADDFTATRKMLIMNRHFCSFYMARFPCLTIFFLNMAHLQGWASFSGALI